MCAHGSMMMTKILHVYLFFVVISDTYTYAKLGLNSLMRDLTSRLMKNEVSPFYDTSISKKTVFSLDKTLDVLSRNKIDINEKNFFKIKMLFLD